MELFRREALSGRQTAATETPFELPLIHGLNRVVMLAVAGAVLTVIAIVCTKHSVTVAASGKLTRAHGAVLVRADRAGIVDRTLLQPGARVAKGGVLATVSSERARENGEAGANAKIAAFRSELLVVETTEKLAREGIDDERARSLQEAASIRGRLGLLEVQRKLTEERVASAQSRKSRLDEAVRRGIIAAQQADEQADGVLALRSQSVDLALAIVAEQEKERARQATLSRSDFSHRRTLEELAQRKIQIARSIEDLELERSGAFVAPANGRVDAVYIADGEKIAEGDLVASIDLDDGSDYVAEIYVDASSAPMLAEGQEVTLRTRLAPWEAEAKIHGNIEDFGRTAVPAKDLQADESSSSKTLVKVRVRLSDDVARKYPAFASSAFEGTPVSATIIVARRALARTLFAAGGIDER